MFRAQPGYMLQSFHPNGAAEFSIEQPFTQQLSNSLSQSISRTGIDPLKTNIGKYQYGLGLGGNVENLSAGVHIPCQQQLGGSRSLDSLLHFPTVPSTRVSTRKRKRKPAKRKRKKRKKRKKSAAARVVGGRRKKKQAGGKRRKGAKKKKGIKRKAKKSTRGAGRKRKSKKKAPVKKRKAKRRRGRRKAPIIGTDEQQYIF